MKQALLVLLAVLGVARAEAQDTGNIRIVHEHELQLTAAQQRELQEWTKEVQAYRTWYDRHRNRIARNIFGFVGDRSEAPPVVSWLPAKCDLLGDFVPPPSGILSDGCNLLSFYRSRFTVDPAAQQTLIAQKQNEQESRSSFWKHVHLDAGWGSLDYRRQTYGLVGVHVTLPELAKRVQFYLPPGFLLLSVPDGRGGRELQPAATVGVSIKMFEFEFPHRKEGTAYFNLAKAYFIGQSTSLNASAAVDLVGLSFSWGR